jgi:hypothetical protein
MIILALVAQAQWFITLRQNQSRQRKNRGRNRVKASVSERISKKSPAKKKTGITGKGGNHDT